jgi:hypothetical protein
LSLWFATAVIIAVNNKPMVNKSSRIEQNTAHSCWHHGDDDSILLSASRAGSFIRLACLFYTILSPLKQVRCVCFELFVHKGVTTCLPSLSMTCVGLCKKCTTCSTMQKFQNFITNWSTYGWNMS